MSNNEMKKKIKEILPFFMIFLFFFYIFGITPPVCDRWMEGSIHQTYGNSLRLLFGQIRWMQVANGRIISNLFSAIVDGNGIWFRAFVNAAMLGAFSYIAYKLIDVKNEIIKMFMVTLPVMVSFTVWQEVYYYATTLFMSTSLIGVVWLYLMCKVEWDNLSKQRQGLLFVLALISATWLENLSMALCVGSFILLVYDFIESKKCNKAYLKLFFSFVGGFILLLLSSMFAVSGRLSYKREFSFSKIVNNFVNINIEHSLILGILAITVMLIIRYNRGKFNKIQYSIQMLFLLGVTTVYTLNSLKRVYLTIRTNPYDYDYCNLLYAWRPFQFDIVDMFFYLLNKVNGKLGFIIYVSFFVFILYVIFHHCVNKKEEIAILSMAVLGSSISILGLQSGARIHTLSIYLFIVLIGFFINEINKEEKFEYRNIHILKYVWIVLVVFNMFSQYQFIIGQKSIADERTMIAQEVYKKQIVGEWDMENYVTFPAFRKDENGWGLIHDDRLNPTEADVYYDILKRYYRLDLDTKISYK